MSEKNKQENNNSVEEVKDIISSDTKPKRKISEKNLAVIITAAILAVILISVSIFFIVDTVTGDKFFEYDRANLSKYVKISESDYKNYTLNVDIAKPKDIELDVAILSLLASDKGEALYNGSEVKSDFTVTPGAKIKIWYRGYILDNDGNPIDVGTMSNFANSSPYEIEIGSGAFIPGFELGLVGKNTADYPDFVKITDPATEITTTNIAYVSFTRLPDGGDEKKDTTKALSTRIDLSAEDIDNDFGNGFKDKILAATIGEKQSFDVTLNGKTYHYTDVCVDFVTDCEQNPIVVTAYFPYDYPNNANLRNETAYFEVYVESGVLYEQQAFDDEYVKELISREGSTVTLDELMEYDGEALTDKYRSYAQKIIDDLYAEEYEKAVSSAAWSHILSKTEILKYPENKVLEIQNEYIEDVKYQYETLGGTLKNEYTGETTTYDTLDSFAVAYLGLYGTNDWKTYLYQMSQSLVKERLVLYYIIENEGLSLSKKELKQAVADMKQEYLDEYVKQYLDYEKKTREDFTDEEYEKYVDARENEIFSYYDDEHFKETVIYEILNENMIKWPTVSTLDDRRAYPLDK